MRVYSEAALNINTGCCLDCDSVISGPHNKISAYLFLLNVYSMGVICL